MPPPIHSQDAEPDDPTGDVSADSASTDESCLPRISQADLLEALHLLSVAEIGLRISIEKGMSYYQNRLRQTIDLQERVRDELDGFLYIR